MSDTFEIELEGKTTVLEVKPLTLIVPSPDNFDDIKYKNVVTLDLEVCLYHQERLTQRGIHEDTWKMMRMVFKDRDTKKSLWPDEQCTVEYVKQAGL